MTHIAGKNGHVYSSALLLDNCEDAWTAGTGATAVSTTTGKVGTNAARGTTTTLGATTLMMYETIEIGSTDITAYDGIYLWLRSSLTTSAGDLKFLIDEGTDCSAPEESINLPALTANTWRQCFVRISDPSVLNAVQSIGLYQQTNLDDGTFDVDDVEALAEQDGIKSWTLDYTADVLETTDFADSGVKSFIIGGSGWSGSFEGYKDGVPISIGSEVYLTLGESSTAYQCWIGKVIVTAAHPNTSNDGVVTYSYDFQGTGALQAPDA